MFIILLHSLYQFNGFLPLGSILIVHLAEIAVYCVFISIKHDISTFKAVYSSEEAKKYQWKTGAEISIDIYPADDLEITPCHYSYYTDDAKKNWYEYFQVWKGFKNRWYEYMQVWGNSIAFVRTE